MLAPMLALAVSVVLPLLDAGAAPASGVTGSTLTSRGVSASGLAADVKAVSDRTWLLYEVPLVATKLHACCWSGIDRRPSRRTACRLGPDGGVNVSTDDHIAGYEPGARLLVALRVEKGRVSAVRAFTPSCAVDTGNEHAVFLEGVAPAESLAVLEAVAAQGDEEAFAPIALTAGPGATQTLDRLVSAGRVVETRKTAAFWLCLTRGEDGFRRVLELVKRDPDAEFRKEAVFAVSQSSVPAAAPALVALAKEDRDGEVRAQALFWLAQKAGEQAVGAIDDALTNDPDEEVKEQAVFALTQLPKDESVKQLLRVAKTNRSAAVKKQAIFWLGQTRDPRAVDYLSEVVLGK